LAILFVSFTSRPAVNHRAVFHDSKRILHFEAYSSATCSDFLVESKSRIVVMKRYLTVDEVSEHFEPSSWQRVIFAEFEATLLSKSRPFPCVFGVTGIKSRQIRVAFPDPLTPEVLAPILSEYLRDARSCGRMTSLVVFARPGPVADIEWYRARMWSLLDGLERIDTVPRPEAIPRQIDHPAWEFCFGGEPIFVSTATPANVLRQSRRSSTLLAVFQPRWVFDGIVGSDDPAIQRSLKMIRDRIRAFDAVPVFPMLGQYGNSDNREYMQYFLDDSNGPQACPFDELGRQSDREQWETDMTAPGDLAEAAERDPQIYTAQIDTTQLDRLIARLLPDQGCIEVQRDVAGKEHRWHSHDTDETLVILEGQLRFYWDQGEKVAGPGTVIGLPAGMLHGSVALDGGATYLIAFHQVDIPQHG
jgi:FPC/CPF motif-containing protein YcgG/quercetin dioxygenase-like cupin family protein